MIGVDWNGVNLALGIIVSVGFLIGFIWGFAKLVVAFNRWRHKRLARTVAEDLAAIRKETIPNGGSSLRDAIDRIEKNQGEMAQKVDAIQSALDRHLGFHQGITYHDGLRAL